MRARVQGVTLVELLVALTVVAILTAVAWPGYAAVTLRAHRIDARLALLRIQQLQERHYAVYLRYASALGSTANADTLSAESTVASGRFGISLETSDDAQRYIAMARVLAESPQVRDRDCQQFSLDHSGMLRSADAEGRWTDGALRCWR